MTVADTPSSLLAAGLVGQGDAPSDATSERILDAALTLAAASGLRNLTMDDVAARAKVGRMTVYRRFGDKQHLVEALGAREVRRCLAELDAAGDPSDPIAEQIADGFVASMRIAREHPLLNRLASVEPEVVLEATIADGAATFTVARGYLAARLRVAQAEGSLGDLDVDAAAEILVRLAISFVLIQPTTLPLDDEQRTKALARELIAPIVSSGRVG